MLEEECPRKVSLKEVIVLFRKHEHGCERNMSEFCDFYEQTHARSKAPKAS